MEHECLLPCTGVRCRILCDMLSVLWWACSSQPNPHAWAPPLVGCPRLLFSIFTATLQIWTPSPLSATWERAVPWWQETYLNMKPIGHFYKIFPEILNQMSRCRKKHFFFETYFPSSSICAETGSPGCGLLSPTDSPLVQNLDTSIEHIIRIHAVIQRCINYEVDKVLVNK
jgi:hypothetical protein